MSELKARLAYFSEDDYERGEHKICAKVSDCGYDRKNDWWSYAFEDEVYLKSEADKVIAELIEKNERLSDDCLIKTSNTFREIEKEIRHHKYKRCLAMADYCKAQYDYEDRCVNGCGLSWEYISPEMKYWERWQMCWLKLAEEPTWAKFLQLIHKETAKDGM